MIQIPAVDRPIQFSMSGSSPSERIEPITLDWLKLHQRFPSANEDTMLTAFIGAARAYFEEHTGRQLIDAEWEYALDVPPDCQTFFELPRPPLSRVTAILYEDSDGVAQTWDASNYVVHPSYAPANEGSPDDPIVFDPYCPCGRLALASGGSWPSTSGRPGSFKIRRVCGYGPADTDMPPLIQGTIALLVQHFRDRDKGELPAGPDALIKGFKWSAIQNCPPVRTWPWTVPSTCGWQ